MSEQNNSILKDYLDSYLTGLGFYQKGENLYEIEMHEQCIMNMSLVQESTGSVIFSSKNFVGSDGEWDLDTIYGGVKVHTEDDIKFVIDRCYFLQDILLPYARANTNETHGEKVVM